jgi:DNA polymerase-3 subunit epsilon
LHGALLDAQLLAEVYLAMTRGQETLAMEPIALTAAQRRQRNTTARIRVLRASAEELAAHAQYMQEMARDCADACAW